MMAKPTRGSMNIGLSVGTSSILVIFVLLCLTTFATLSLVSANADYKLTARAAQSASNYYAADAAAEERLAGISAELELLRATAPEAQYLALAAESATALFQGVTSELSLSDGRGFLSYSVPLGETQELAVRLEILPATEEGYVKRLEWKVRNLPATDPVNEAINGLWNGEDAVLPLD